MRPQPQQPGVPLAVVRGIPIRLHWSLFPVFGLIAYSLATNVFRDEIPEGSPDVAWLLGLATAAAFLLSIVLHELGHAIIAQRNRMTVGSITLFFFGGVASVEEEPRTAGIEFRVAAGGPLVSVLLAAAFFGSSQVEGLGNLLTTAFWWLGTINLALLLFNLIPGYPLDGGRLLRSAIWHFNGSETTATRIAVRGGQLVAMLLVGYGVFTIVRSGSTFNGLWTIMLAFFLQNAATSTGAHVIARSILERGTAAQTMARDIIYVPARTRIQELLDHHKVIEPRQAFVVVEDGPLGVVSLMQLAFVPRERWPWTVVTQVMTPWRQLVEIAPDTNLLTALQQMDAARSSYAVVREPSGDVAGILSRDQIALRLHTSK